MKLAFTCVLLFITKINGEDSQDVPNVEISNGLLQGVYEKSYNGRIFSAFEGIPYARPPVGDLRFEAPREPYNWTGTWIANTKHVCLQYQESATSGDEDCLYLNVYVPREIPNPSDNLNVIVHIHGGAFIMLSPHYYCGPKYLMDEDVIFVTMSYRLGPFGFLSTQDEVVPGNNGLKDQALSLQWIQKNIKYFGGNPNSVTITGMSAGSASVHLHYLSPLSNGLFHAGVSQSGTALDPWVIQSSPLRSTTYLAEELGCATESSREMIDCIKSRSGTKIAEKSSWKVSSGYPLIPFGPVIEPEHDGAFLTQQPHEMLRGKAVADIPWVVSVAENEGIAQMILLGDVLVKLGENFASFIPHMLYYDDIDEETQKSVTAEVENNYFKETADVIEAFTNIIGDRLFNSGAVTAARLQARANKSPVYFYKFGYKGQHSFVDLFAPNSKHTDATHGDDVQYYLQTPSAEGKLSESDGRMKSIFLQWLLNFAEAEEPKIEGVKWNPVSGGEALEFLNLQGPDNLFMDATENWGSPSFWSTLPLKENELHNIIRDEL